MDRQTLAIEPIGGGVVSLRMFVGDEPHIDAAFVVRLARTVAHLGEDATVRVIVIEGGEQYFSAGASREALIAKDPQRALLPKLAEIPRLILSLRVPTIAAMTGHAIGSGLLVGLWCDIAILAEESLYGVNAAALGLPPVMGSSAVLEEALGAPLARELLLTGHLLTGREIKQSCALLAHGIVPRASVRERALALAREIADLPPEPMATYKEALSVKRRAKFEQAIRAEEAIGAKLFSKTGILDQVGERYPVAYAQSRKE